MTNRQSRTLRQVETLRSGVDAGAELARKVRAILPQIAANAERTEQERRIPDENIALLREAGFFRTFVPARYGGLELGLVQYGPALVELSSACGASGWVGSLFAQHVYLAAQYSREAQDEIWSEDPDTLIGSSVAPVGKANIVPDGVQLSGRFGFSSGCDHAQWFILGFRHPGFDPPFDRQYALVPRCDVTILDDWNTAGMRGSGSKTLIVDGAFVPDHRCESVLGLSSGRSKGFGSNDNAIYHGSIGPHFTIGFPAVAIGMALRMAEVYAEMTKSRIKVYTGAQATARSPAAIRLARGKWAAEAALTFLEKDWRDIDARNASRQLPTPGESARWRTNMSYCIHLAIEAVDEMFGGAGGKAWFESNEMQRLWRDTHMCGAHAGTDYDTCSEIYGRHLLGLDPDPSL